MHIHSLTISGFKSYRDATTVTFHKGANVVVGRNGSGKSNFFSAVRFVLSDSYNSLQREERNALLHEGSGATQTFSAYVEIVFDNKDGRFPTGKDTLTLRRTIGAKKDDYQLDRKSTSKGEVMSILESAGFSRSNPYYIVPQGRITHLTNLKDAERLDLLKEVAGTKVYEDRRSESLKIMEETDQKRTKIDELLKYIEERLTELEEEKEELKEFQTKDRDRRCLEYAIYQRDLEEVSAALEEIEAERKKDRASAVNQRKDFATRQKQISAIEGEITDVKKEIELLKLDASELSAERQESVKVRTQLECLIRDSQEGRRRTADNRTAWSTELDQIERLIVEKEAELMEVVPELEGVEKQEAEVRQRHAQAKTAQEILYAKQGRSSQFRTQAERDRYLQSEISQLRSSVATYQKRIADTRQDIESRKRTLSQVEGRAGRLVEELEGRGENIKRLKVELDQAKAEKEGKSERKKELWKEQLKVGQVEKSANEELRRGEGELRSMMDKQTSSGLRSLERIVNQLQIEGVYGPVYELFQVGDHYRTAVEVTAGNSLFHVVCDTDETVQKILTKMNQDRSGRLTFIPLNRVRTRQHKYPSGDDAVPMIKKLQFDPAVTPAMENIFGRTIICKNMATAAEFTRSHNLDGITLDGDRVDRKGTLTGGYQDPNRSRLQTVRRVQHEKNALDAARLKAKEIDVELGKLNGEINTLQNRQEKLERELAGILGRRKSERTWK
ncbi:hypothetical protein BT69DRAFT_1314073 [Atractiella rhizophila]|nr:hypothetical protein BT69DRAFT_1314073 [Atractiella rhizophila]